MTVSGSRRGSKNSEDRRRRTKRRRLSARRARLSLNADVVPEEMTTNRVILIGTALLFAVGCRGGSPDVRELPLSKHACRVIDRSPLEITVRVVRKDEYRVGEMSMNGSSLVVLLTNAVSQYGKGIPVAIQAGPQTHFGVVWQAVQLASTNGCVPAFDTRVPNVDWPKKLTFLAAESVVVTSNALPTVSIACAKDGIRVTSRPITLAELQRTLQELAAISRDMSVSISAAEYVPHQEVINILDACEGVGIRHRLVGLKKE
jgi:biopolymer transport protein ExbD